MGILLRAWSFEPNAWLRPWAKAARARWTVRDALARRWTQTGRPSVREIVEALERTDQDPWARLAKEIRAEARAFDGDVLETCRAAARYVASAPWAERLRATYFLLEHPVEGREALLERRGELREPAKGQAFYFAGLTPEVWLLVWLGFAIASLGVSPALVGVLTIGATLLLHEVPVVSRVHVHLAERFAWGRFAPGAKKVRASIANAIEEDLGEEIWSTEMAGLHAGRVSVVLAELAEEQRRRHPGEAREWVCSGCQVRAAMQSGFVACRTCGSIEDLVHAPGPLVVSLDGKTWRVGDVIGEVEAVRVDGATDLEVEAFLIGLGNERPIEETRQIACRVESGGLSANTMALLRRTLDCEDGGAVRPG